MKKKLLSIFAFSAIAFNVNAQILNSDFENWTNNGQYNMLNDYVTSNEVYWAEDAFLGTFSIVSTHELSVNQTTGYTGSYAVSVKNVTQTTNGVVVDTLPGYAALINANGDGMPYTGRPTALTGYYKFNQGAPADKSKDTARIYVMLGKGNTPGQPADSIGGGSIKIYETTSSFTPFTINIGYIDGSTPDTLFFGFISTLQDSNAVNLNADTIYPSTELILDDIALTGVTGTKTPLFSKGVQTYPNPATDIINIKNIPQGAVNIDISDFKGQRVKSIPFSSDFINVNTSDLSTGLYYYSIKDTNGDVIYADRFNVVK